MKTPLRLTITASALLGSVGLSAAQMSSPSSRSSAEPRAASPGGTSSQMQPLQLSNAQKSAIYNAVKRQNVTTATPSNLRAAVGAPVPPSTELYALPDGAVA